ncbi:MAG: hypothetical protein EHM58_02430 [Ignavibacteriae bacterium]|nr:MAG: hypothetical protein EHM58_02430 [Ignavibacteriota bacterium]
MKKYTVKNFLRDQKEIYVRYNKSKANVFELYSLNGYENEQFPYKIISDYCHETYSNDNEIDSDIYASIIIKIIRFIQKNRRVLEKQNLFKSVKEICKIHSCFLEHLINECNLSYQLNGSEVLLSHLSNSQNKRFYIFLLQDF